eukprot:87432_1
MRKYNTSTEKIFTVTKFLGLYGDISKENEYKPQFRLRMKVVIPFSSDIKSINKKDEINLNTVSQWKVTTTRTKKIQLNRRNLSIQEAWNYRVLLASYNDTKILAHAKVIKTPTNFVIDDDEPEKYIIKQLFALKKMRKRLNNNYLHLKTVNENVYFYLSCQLSFIGVWFY